MVMAVAGMGDALRERLPALWRRIEDAHYSYLETDDSPDKLQQRKKLEGYIIEYLSLVPHECKFGLSETGKVFQRSINELTEWSAYRAGLGWAALARYANNLLAQPWRKEYKVIRLYCGYYKHEIEANMVGAETLLHAMGYKGVGAGRVALLAPACPDMVAAVSRDAIIAHAECQIMSHIWESVWNGGGRVSWAEIARDRATHASDAADAAARLAARAGRSDRHLSYIDGSEIYSNVPVTVQDYNRQDARYHNTMVPPSCGRLCDDTPVEEPITPMVHPYMVPNMLPPHMMYPVPQHISEVIPNPVPMMTPYVPYGVPYYPVQPPYMIPTPVYNPIKHANNVPVNGYPPIPQYRYPSVPTAQLIELDSPSVYENGKHAHRDEDRHKRRPGESSRRDSTSKSNFSDITLPSIPRSDTQPTLSKAKEDGMGTYESWDYVFRNLSSKHDEGEKNRYSPSFDRDSRTLDRLDREERRSKYQPTTLDLEDGLRALNLDKTHDEDVYRTAKVNENLMRLKQEQEKKARQARKAAEAKRKIEPNNVVIKADALITPKTAPDKVKLLTKRDVKERKEVLRHQSMNGAPPTVADVRKVKKPAKLLAGDADKQKKPVENGLILAHSSKASTNLQQYDLKAQLVVSLDETDSKRPLPKVNGDRPSSRTSHLDDKKDRWECNTCTYLNKNTLQACEMCGKSRKLPEIQPLTSGGRECPACTLVNKREATACDACGTSLEHCPTYI